MRARCCTCCTGCEVSEFNHRGPEAQRRKKRGIGLASRGQEDQESELSADEPRSARHLCASVPLWSKLGCWWRAIRQPPPAMGFSAPVSCGPRPFNHRDAEAQRRKKRGIGLASRGQEDQESGLSADEPRSARHLCASVPLWSKLVVG